MKIFGKKLADRHEHKELGRKLIFSNTLGRKLSQQNTQRHHINPEHKEPGSDLEYRSNRDHIKGVDIHRQMPENMLTNITHHGKSTKNPWERHKFH